MWGLQYPVVSPTVSRRTDSVSLSLCIISGLIWISLGSAFALDNKSDMSMVQFNLTSTGRGFFD